MNLEMMISALSLERVPACFSGLYKEMEYTWQSHAREILEESYIRRVFADAHCLLPWQDQILEAAALLSKDEPRMLLLCLLEAWIRGGGEPASPDYQPPAGEGLAHRFFHLFPAIPTIPESAAHLRSRGVPEDVVTATLGEYDFCVNMLQDRTGVPGFDRGRLNWITRVIRNKLIRIDRFKYDLPGKFLEGVRVYRKGDALTVLAEDLTLHRSGRILGSVGHKDAEGSFTARIRETETAVIGHRVINGLVEAAPVTLDKSQWHLCLTSQDTFPRIHIPSDGAFDRQTMEASFRRAREIFRDCYPDYPYQGFYCTSWLMSTDLQEILKPTSNILAFQSFFTQVPRSSSGAGVFSFLYGMAAAIPEDLDALPENTSLQKAVKARYKAGGFIHEGAGFFL